MLVAPPTESIHMRPCSHASVNKKGMCLSLPTVCAIRGVPIKWWPHARPIRLARRLSSLRASSSPMCPTTRKSGQPGKVFARPSRKQYVGHSSAYSKVSYDWIYPAATLGAQIHRRTRPLACVVHHAFARRGLYQAGPLAGRIWCGFGTDCC